MAAIANHKSSIFRASTWAGIAVVLTVGITSSSSTQLEAPANAPAAKSAGANPVNPAPVAAKPVHHWYQFGKASWYGQDFQGHPTASGETFNMFDLTCAHRSLPLGSLVRVTNLRNRKSVVLRVNDRGPMEDDRIVDLSYAAAAFIGVRGIAKVRIELLPAVAELELRGTTGR
jgi:rare lipoprotein A